MPVATSSAMAAVAASQAAIASAEAHRALVERCKATIQNFDAQRATVADMREYSGCVDAVYPSDMSGDTTMALKILFMVALIGFGVGTWRNKADGNRWEGWNDHILYGVMWFFLAPCAVAFFVGVLCGIWWLLT